MKDIVNSFKAHLYERTSSPLLGAFIFYWLICNYKMIVILFDDNLTSVNKFIQIDKLYNKDIFQFIGINIPINALLLPVAITLLYILIFPFISNLIHKAWIWHQNKLKEISNGKVLTKKEFGDLQRRFTELELSFDDTFLKKDNEITQLKKLLDEKELLIIEYQRNLNQNTKEEVNIKNYEETIEKLEKYNEKLEQMLPSSEKERLAIKENITSIEINILTHIGNYPNENTILSISNSIGTDLIYAEHYIEKLEQLKLIEINFINQDESNTYKLTPKGRNFIIKHRENLPEIDEDEIPF